MQVMLFIHKDYERNLLIFWNGGHKFFVPSVCWGTLCYLSDVRTFLARSGILC